MKYKKLPTESFELELAYQTEMQGFAWKSVGRNKGFMVEIRYYYLNSSSLMYSLVYYEVLVYI